MALRIRIVGVGGQGVNLALRVLGLAVTSKGGYAAFHASYGAEVRGTPVVGDVVVSSTSVMNPYFKVPDVTLLIHPSALRALGEPPRLLLVADEAAQLQPTPPCRVVWAPMLRTAYELGGLRRSSMIALGVLSGLGVVDVDALLDTLASLGLLDDANAKAVEAGKAMVSGLEGLELTVI